MRAFLIGLFCLVISTSNFKAADGLAIRDPLTGRYKDTQHEINELIKRVNDLEASVNALRLEVTRQQHEIYLLKFSTPISDNNTP